MKKIPLLILILSVYSCNGFLDSVQPENDLLIEDLLQSGEDLEAGLTGLYDLMQNGAALAGNIPALADVMAGNAEGWFVEISSLQMEPSHWMTEEIWSTAYRAINQANAIIAALPFVINNDPGFSLAQANQIEGEARFIRGLLYFEMVRLYALPWSNDNLNKPGVPLVLEPVFDQSSITFPARASVGQVYEQVEIDLTKAMELMAETNTDGKASGMAAAAGLAEVAFQKNDFLSVVDLTGQILASGHFQLTELPQDFFREEGSSEEIWVIKGSTNNDPVNDGLATVYNDAPKTATISNDLKANGYKTLLTDAMAQQIASQNLTFVDLRCDPHDIFSKGDLIVTGDTARCNKYENSWTSGEDDTPLYRLAEILLMRSEALARIQGINQESIDLLNQIRQRSMRVLDQSGFLVPESYELVSYSMEDFQNSDELVEAIVKERRVELAFEGNYLHDLKRLRRAVLNYGTIYPFDSPDLILPLPQREIDANPALEQNP